MTITLHDEFPELDMYPLNTQDADDDLFITDMDNEDEPDDNQLLELEKEANQEKFLPIESTFNFKCVRCGGFHDMFKTKSDGNGSFICPKTGRVI